VFAETQADFEQWASTDPLGEELSVGDDDVEDGEEELELEPSDSELFLNPNPGDTL
jgi:hypothetical protein